ncbi:MAG: PKD domain-containing protein [Bacteroidota bacterium]
MKNIEKTFGNIKSLMKLKTVAHRCILIMLLACSGTEAHAQYLELTPCAYQMIAGFDSLVKGLGYTSCFFNARDRRVLIDASCSMPGCNPDAAIYAAYIAKYEISPNFRLYWHTAGDSLAFPTQSMCIPNMAGLTFPDSCGANHSDAVWIMKIVNGVLVKDSVPNLIAIENPRLMTPASPFWPLVHPSWIVQVRSPWGILVDVTDVNGQTYTASFVHYYISTMVWKQVKPCPTITSFAESSVPVSPYGCSKFNLAASISGYNVSCPNSIIEAAWNFRDGTPVVTNCADNGGASMVHQYSAPGSYNVLLTLTMAGTGTCSVVDSEAVVVTCAPPPCDDCISSFSPIAGKKYVVSAWAKEDSPAQSRTNYTYPAITLLFPSVSGSAGPFAPSGNIIDGWQRIEAEFTVPSLATDITVELDCSTGDCYYDDIRIFPVDGSMKSYVYDPVTMRLVAELDERNYATLYEYDEEGKLIRVKKETEKGKMTIKETREYTKQ